MDISDFAEHMRYIGKADADELTQFGNDCVGLISTGGTLPTAYYQWQMCFAAWRKSRGTKKQAS